MPETLIRDRRILVVEDEYMIAQSLQRGLERAGATVLGPVPNITDALTLLQSEQDLDAAVLDINLGEEKVYPVVDALLARGIRCVFATGNDAADVPPAYAAIARCEKPINTASLIQALAGSSDVVVLDKTSGTPQHMRRQLLSLVEIAERRGNTLLAARLCEALDAIR